jgi:hypothetical protein
VKHALEDMASEDEARKWAREAAAAAKVKPESLNPESLRAELSVSTLNRKP